MKLTLEFPLLHSKQFKPRMALYTNLKSCYYENLKVLPNLHRLYLERSTTYLQEVTYLFIPSWAGTIKIDSTVINNPWLVCSQSEFSIFSKLTGSWRKILFGDRFENRPQHCYITELYLKFNIWYPQLVYLSDW